MCPKEYTLHSMVSLDGFAPKCCTPSCGIVIKESGWEMSLRQAFKYLRMRFGATSSIIGADN
jgi:hypothetical protein